MNHVQMVFVVTMAVLSAANGGRQRRAPQFVPVFSLHDDIHNHITGLTFDLHNRIAATAHHSIANSFAHSANAFNSNGGVVIRHPNNGNTFVQAFGHPGQQGIFISTFSGVPVRPSVSPVRPFTTSLRPTSTPSRPVSTPSRPVSIPLRPASTPLRPASVSSSLPVPASLRPTSTRPLLGNSIHTNSGRPFAAAAAGPRPGGGVSASAVAVSTSG